MGNQASVPKPGVKFQIIGAGLPRTGTASFSEALRILLDEPVYHGGTQIVRGPPQEVRSWTKVFSILPKATNLEKRQILKVIETYSTGYAASVDAPAFLLVPEFLEVYPDAIVICTVRDPVAWARSMANMGNLNTTWFLRIDLFQLSMMLFLRIVLFPLSTMRYFVGYITALGPTFDDRYGEHEPSSTASYHRHMEYLKRTVPSEKLFFFDVKDGWEPLCKILGKEVPKDTPFPKINDSAAIERIAKEMVIKGMTRWAIIVATPLAALVAYLYMRVGH
jgi:hypothetical protein